MYPAAEHHGASIMGTPTVDEHAAGVWLSRAKILLNGVCVGAANYLNALFKVELSTGAMQYGTPTNYGLAFTEHTAGT